MTESHQYVRKQNNLPRRIFIEQSQREGVQGGGGGQGFDMFEKKKLFQGVGVR